MRTAIIHGEMVVEMTGLRQRPVVEIAPRTKKMLPVRMGGFVFRVRVIQRPAIRPATEALARGPRR